MGVTFVITGRLSIERVELVNRIETAGGKVSGSVSKKTDFVVSGSESGLKLDKARELNVPVIDEQTYAENVGRCG